MREDTLSQFVEDSLAQASREYRAQLRRAYADPLRTLEERFAGLVRDHGTAGAVRAVEADPAVLGVLRGAGHAEAGAEARRTAVDAARRGADAYQWLEARGNPALRADLAADAFYRQVARDYPDIQRFLTEWGALRQAGGIDGALKHLRAMDPRLGQPVPGSDLDRTARLAHLAAAAQDAAAEHQRAFTEAATERLARLPESLADLRSRPGYPMPPVLQESLAALSVRGRQAFAAAYEDGPAALDRFHQLSAASTPGEAAAAVARTPEVLGRLRAPAPGVAPQAAPLAAQGAELCRLAYRINAVTNPAQAAEALRELYQRRLAALADRPTEIVTWLEQRLRDGSPTLDRAAVARELQDRAAAGGRVVHAGQADEVVHLAAATLHAEAGAQAALSEAYARPPAEGLRLPDAGPVFAEHSEPLPRQVPDADTLPEPAAPLPRHAPGDAPPARAARPRHEEDTVPLGPAAHAPGGRTLPGAVPPAVEPDPAYAALVADADRKARHADFFHDWSDDDAARRRGARTVEEMDAALGRLDYADAERIFNQRRPRETPAYDADRHQRNQEKAAEPDPRAPGGPGASRERDPAPGDAFAEAGADPEIARLFTEVNTAGAERREVAEKVLEARRILADIEIDEGRYRTAEAYYRESLGRIYGDVKGADEKIRDLVARHQKRDPVNGLSSALAELERNPALAGRIGFRARRQAREEMGRATQYLRSMYRAWGDLNDPKPPRTFTDLDGRTFTRLEDIKAACRATLLDGRQRIKAADGRINDLGGMAAPERALRNAQQNALRRGAGGVAQVTHLGTLAGQALQAARTARDVAEGPGY